MAIARSQRQQAPHAASSDDESLYDPIEDDPEVQPLLAKADAIAEAELGERAHMMGSPFWAVKQRILREQFGIVWFSPAEMNPDCIDD